MVPKTAAFYNHSCYLALSQGAVFLFSFIYLAESVLKGGRRERRKEGKEGGRREGGKKERKDGWMDGGREGGKDGMCISDC